MMIRRGLMSGKFEKPVTLKTYVNTDVIGSNYKACNIPIVNNGMYYIYIKLSGYSLAPKTLLNLWKDGLSSSAMVTIDFYLGKIRLSFIKGEVITNSSLSSAAYPKTICCALSFKDGFVYGEIFDGSSNSLSDTVVLANSFETPTSINVYNVVDTNIVTKLMIRALDNT